MTDFYGLHTQLLRIAVDLVEEHNLPGTGRDLADIATKLRDAYTEQSREIAEHRDAATTERKRRYQIYRDGHTLHPWDTLEQAQNAIQRDAYCHPGHTYRIDLEEHTYHGLRLWSRECLQRNLPTS